MGGLNEYSLEAIPGVIVVSEFMVLGYCCLSACLPNPLDINLCCLLSSVYSESHNCFITLDIIFVVIHLADTPTYRVMSNDRE